MPRVDEVTTPVYLVGECNPYGGDDYFALYPSPEGCSGHCLCYLVLGMRTSAYLEAFRRVNLCRGQWRTSDAVEAALRLLTGGGRFVLLGSKVCSAFGVPYLPFRVRDEVLLVLPHPSGLCRLWNEEGSFGRARECVATFAPELAHLLGVCDDAED